MALGELIEESRGKVTGERVLDVETPKLETSVTMEGNFRGIPCKELLTYSAVIREEGVLYGEGQGMIMAKDGGGMASWTGQGIGKYTSTGKVSFRGSVFIRSPAGGKLSQLNNVVGVFEYEGDEMGNCTSKTWEWK